MPQPQYFFVSVLSYGGQDFQLTYHSASRLAVGQLVEVPLGRSSSLGVVTGITPKPEFTTKPVSRQLDLKPLPAHLVSLAAWLAGYYAASPRAVWQTLLPAGLEVKRRPQRPAAVKAADLNQLQLTAQQQAALTAISSSPNSAFLLHGVTGAGKTLVYIELAQAAINAGRSAIILVPEIALTPQTMSRFSSSFGDRVLLTHSHLTPAQRHQIWSSCLEAAEPLVVIGPRSALFLPLANIGLVVIDEFHENTYKQEQSPRYQASVAAAKLVKLTDAKLVLGSATPSLTELHWAKLGRIKLVELTQRFNAAAVPLATIVDLRQKHLLRRSRYLSTPLIQAVTQSLAAGRQSLLFINRRGTAGTQLCGDCGQVSDCPRCQLPLTFHADRLILLCHWCNWQSPPAAVCSACSSSNVRYLGAGTKRIETEVASLWPTARVARLDRDSAKGAHVEAVFSGLRQDEIDILIGTQMIAKGLDIAKLDTVGVVSADTMLYLPDFSAAERTFQLLTQVSGRAGRRGQASGVFIQTYSPEHPAIVAAAAADFKRFAAAELANRQLLGYPPFVFLLKLSCRAKTSQQAQAKAGALIDKLSGTAGLTLSGPAPAFREVQGGYYHWQVIARSRSRQALVGAVGLAGSDFTADLDPVNLL